ncbi:hypothetical protein FDP41_004953 [Naegleria fowleri]|uniref:Uncharacterized protein n=1 Tax=Naegleria fowleri TaxID=5763 RepID=A0A6A5BPZ6_NAEFO|nr:uncharacterized protein FDP41_004953 [Naegleria fowleri]KAF0976278.1 hypothetical protein FDP41_004953 [Naegleria fowleri]
MNFLNTNSPASTNSPATMKPSSAYQLFQSGSSSSLLWKTSSPRTPATFINGALNVEIINHHDDDEIMNEDDDEPLDLGLPSSLSKKEQDLEKIAISVVSGTNNLRSSPQRHRSTSELSFNESSDQNCDGMHSRTSTAMSSRSDDDHASTSTTTRAVTNEKHGDMVHDSAYTIPSTLTKSHHYSDIVTERRDCLGPRSQSEQRVILSINNREINSPSNDDDHTKDDPLAVNLKPSRISYQSGMKKKNTKFSTQLKDNQAVLDSSFCDLKDEELLERQKKLKKILKTSSGFPPSIGLDALAELKRKMEMKDEDMDIMNGIIDFAKKEEQKLLSKTGNFSAIAKYERESKRQDEKRTVSKLLNTVKNRQNSDSPSGGSLTKRSDSSISMSSRKQKWVEESKKKGRENFREHLWGKKMEEMAMEARINHEKTVENFKLHHDKLYSDYQQLLQQMNLEKETSQKCQEENKSLKYTIEMLRQKLNKQSVREIEKEQRLRLFENYEPLFETLQKNFNFDSPYDVIKRIEILEKAQADSLTQLFEAQEQKAALERQFEKYKVDIEYKHRQAINDLEKQIERDQNQLKEVLSNMRNIQQTLEQSENYRQKYLVLSDSVIDLWHTWVKDVEKLGYRDTTIYMKNGEHNMNGAQNTLIMLGEPDFSDSNQVMSAVKNLLIAFTPNKAGHSYTELAKMANGYWLKYFKTDFDIKSKPKLIFEKMAQAIEAKNSKIRDLERRLKETEESKKNFEEGMNKAIREKRALEVQTNIVHQQKRPQSAGPRLKNTHHHHAGISSPTLRYIYGLETTATAAGAATTTSTTSMSDPHIHSKKLPQRPQSAHLPFNGSASKTSSSSLFHQPAGRHAGTLQHTRPFTAGAVQNAQRPSSASGVVGNTSLRKRPQSAAPSTKRPSSARTLRPSDDTSGGKCFFITQSRYLE